MKVFLCKYVELGSSRNLLQNKVLTVVDSNFYLQQQENHCSILALSQDCQQQQKLFIFFFQAALLLNNFSGDFKVDFKGLVPPSCQLTFKVPH